MRSLGFAAVLLFTQTAWAATDQTFPDVSNTSRTEADGTRLLQHGVTIDAPSEEVWAAFVDPQVIGQWSAPMAVVDLRQGGYIEEGFTKATNLGFPDNVRHRIVAYLPGSLLILRNEMAPRGLPGGARFKDLVQIVEIESIDPEHTRLRLSQTGYGNDPEFDKLYRFFESDNPELLGSLKRMLEKQNTAQIASGASHNAR